MQTTVAVIAAKVGLSKGTIRNYADRGIIKSRRDGRGYRIITEPKEAVAKIQAINSGEIRLNDTR